jgi:hypothetical protein
MSTLEIYLSPAAAKLLRNYYDNIEVANVQLRDTFRSLVHLALHTKSNTKVKYDDRLNTKVELEIPSRFRRPSSLTLEKEAWIQPETMLLIDDLLIKWLQWEINLRIEEHTRNKLQVKDAIYFVLDKYDIDPQTEYNYWTARKSYDRWKKSQQK